MKVGKTGLAIRPNTGDTIIAWLKHNPKPGEILAISSQPYVQYQDAVLKTLIPHGFSTETIGPATVGDSEAIAVNLDNVARILYQEQERLRINLP